MPKVVVIAEVEDLTTWEAGFRTHGDLFRRQTISNPISISTGEGNQVALIFEPENLETFMNLLDSEGPEAMADDGVIKETVKIFVMDKEFAI